MAASKQQGQAVRGQDSVDETEAADNAQQKNAKNYSPAISNWEKVAGFVFGVVFITALLSITVLIPDPTPTQYAIFKTILALAAAGVGGVLAGAIHVEGSIQKWSIRAGGAIALFVIVFFFTPSIPEEGNEIHQVINGDNATPIGINKGEINIGVGDAKSKDD